jgi:hypothetical protein
MSISQGLFNLANTQQRVASQAAQVGGGLIDGMFTPDINVNDPMSLQKAAQFQMNRGNVAGGQQLMQQAEKVAADQAQGRIENIRKAFFQAAAQGRTEQFKKAMIEAGYADTVGELETEALERKVAKATGESRLDTRAVEKLRKQYLSAGPEGRRVIEENAKKNDQGDAIIAIKREEADRQYTESLRAHTLAEKERKAAQQEIDKMPVPYDNEGITKVMETVPDEHKDYYLERAKDVVDTRKALREDFASMEEDKDLNDSKMLSLAGWTKEQYDTVKNAFGAKAANEGVYKAAMKNPQLNNVKDEKEATRAPAKISKSDVEGFAPTVAHYFNKQNVGWVSKKWNDVTPDDPDVQAIAYKALWFQRNKGLDPEEAIKAAMNDTTEQGGDRDSSATTYRSDAEELAELGRILAAEGIDINAL